jgi:large exoprotein involved in heme utilization and adhesion
LSLSISSFSQSKNCKPQFKAAKLIAALAIAGLAHHSMAAAPGTHVLPTGGQVVAGAATIATTGNTMNINQSSQRAVVNWSSFDVGSQATVNFNQPNSSAASLLYFQVLINSPLNEY